MKTTTTKLYRIMDMLDMYHGFATGEYVSQGGFMRSYYPSLESEANAAYAELKARLEAGGKTC